MNEVIDGRILKGIGGFYYVDIGDRIISCKARGKFRKLGITPIVGDRVKINIQSDGSGYLLEIEPRTNQLVRPPIANIDMIVIVVSQAPPVTDTFLVDRVSAIAKYQGIEVSIAVNKCDLDTGDELFHIYTNSGFPVYRISGETGEGIDLLKSHLNGKLTAFTGNSGVGKSTILNQVLPEALLKTGDINDKIGRGRHTTRHVEIIKLSENTWIADTPGFSSFDTEQMNFAKKEELQYTFPEFIPFAENCQFIGCAHIKDSGCAVLRAVLDGKLEKSRYESYVRMYESMKDNKEWEHKNV